MQKNSFSFLLLVLVLFFAFKTLPWSQILGLERASNAVESQVAKLSDLPILLYNGESSSWQEQLGEQPAGLLSFWATWCAPCIEELPLLLEAEKNLEMMGIELLAVNFDSGIANASGRVRVEEWLQSHQIALSTLFDPQDIFLEQLGVHALPYNALVTQSGELLWAKHGEVDIAAVVQRWKEFQNSK